MAAEKPIRVNLDLCIGGQWARADQYMSVFA